jgi:transcriptional regulator with XRE-family HTH domain
MMMPFGEQLRLWRLEAGLTQRELADACGIDFTYVSKIERGKASAPAIETLHRLADACGVGRMTMCRAAGRYPTPVDRDELERMWWIYCVNLEAAEEQLIRFRQFIFDRGLAKDFAAYTMPTVAEDAR